MPNDDVVVVPDTNVVVAASIMENAKELGVIKHVFYPDSIQLLSLFKKSKIGFVMPKVRTECFAILSKAVKSTYTPKKNIDVTLKMEIYDELVAIVLSSEYKMREILSRLNTVKLNSKNVNQNLKNVRQMSIHLKSLYNNQYRSSKSRKKTIDKYGKSAKGTWRSGLKNAIHYARRTQIVREGKQLERFMKKYPNSADELILAEVITFKESIHANNLDIFIASSDVGFFVPLYICGGKSDMVTNEIYQRFGIICDHPKEIFRKAGGIL